jgi:DNA-binding CsgD family transcriptional regulator
VTGGLTTRDGAGRGGGQPLLEAHELLLRHLVARGLSLGVDIQVPRSGLDTATAQALLLAAWDAARAALTECLADPGQAGRAQDLLDLLTELRRLSDELRDEQWRERERSFERVRETLALLQDVQSTTELIDQAVIAVCHLGFDRAIVSRVENDLWVAQSVFVGRDVRWAEEILRASQQNPQVVGGALVEAEIVRTGRSVLVPSVSDLPAVHRPIADTSLSKSYVAAPILAHGAVVGFLHADRYYQNRELDETDRLTLAMFGEGLGYALARTAVLDRLAALRADLGRLSSGSNRLWPDGENPAEPTRRLVIPDVPADAGLTRREVDVLQWMARGETNGRIARRLAITEGTVKTHVQSILRKLNAANRAEAVSVWAQMQRSGP